MNALAPGWDALWSDAKAVDIVEVAGRLGAKLRRAGAEYIGHCVAGCTRNGDGFQISVPKGIFLCRPSGATGDVIDLVVHARGCSKTEALEFITGRDRPDRTRDESPEERERRDAARRRQESDALARREREERAEANKRRADEEAVADVLARAVPIAGTHAEAYLRARGLKPLKRMTGDLRFVAALDYWGAADAAAKTKTHLATLPAMVAVVRDVAGQAIGIHQTFLDPVEPRKWAPIGAPSNAAKKIRGQAKGGMIRLGMIGEALAIAEGIESALAWFSLGYGPEDVSLAAGISLGNLCGSSKGSTPHPSKLGADGRAVMVRNGEPDLERPGVVLPAGVRTVYLIGDGDSDGVSTRAALLTAGRRFRSGGREVFVQFAPDGLDFADVALAQRMDAERAG